ncbi:MAG: hypothetical protein QOH43_4529 [Solirubrobacteraceae bacterium]|nr:hypothetical protein [Solirubrobacteraceae bacterium]
MRNGDHVIVPVARVQLIGGGGFGRGSGDGEGAGGGGGGSIDAAPVGFIELGPSGARFESIPDPVATARAVRTGAAALTTLAGALAGVTALRRRRDGGGRRPIGLLRR